MTATFSQPSRRLERLALLLVLLLGLALRLAHFQFFIPYFYYLDEFRTMHLALRLFQERTLDPHFSLYPGFTIYLNAAAAFLYLLAEHAAAVWHSGSLAPVFAAADRLDDHDVNLILVGRSVALLAGTASIYFVYRLGRDLLGPGGGLLSALFFALNPINITFSHLAKLDGFLPLWIALGFWAAGRVITEGRGRWSFLAGLALGLGLATKYNYPPLIFVALAHLLRGSREGMTVFQSLLDRRLLLFILTAAGAAFATSPYWFWDLAENLKTVPWIYLNSQLNSFYHVSDDAWWHDLYFYTLVIHWPFIMGIPLALLSALGFILYAGATRGKGFLLWSYPPCFMYLIPTALPGSVPYYSFIFLVPFACVAAVYVLKRLFDSPALGRKAFAGFLLGLCLVSSAWSVNSYRDYFFGPFDQARPWLEEHLPESADVVLVSVYFLGPAFHFARSESIWPHLVTEEWLQKRQPDYLLVDTRALGGFRKFYRRLWVAPLFDRLLAGELGYRVLHRFPTRYTGERYFKALDVEHDSELVVLKRGVRP